MAGNVLANEYHKQSYLKSELESLGLMQIKLNEFNDAEELRGLVNVIKESFLREYRKSYSTPDAA
jgi:hypothetical protein